MMQTAAHEQDLVDVVARTLREHFTWDASNSEDPEFISLAIKSLAPEFAALGLSVTADTQHVRIQAVAP